MWPRTNSSGYHHVCYVPLPAAAVCVLQRALRGIPFPHFHNITLLARDNCSAFKAVISELVRFFKVDPRILNLVLWTKHDLMLL